MEEITELSRLLDDPACRLLTLLGIGGSGTAPCAGRALLRYRLDFDAPSCATTEYFKSRPIMGSEAYLSREIHDGNI
jgi:hypothetical protein